MRVGGDEMDDAIVNHIKKEYKLLIGQQTAEEIKLEIGSAYHLKEEVQAEVRGRDLMTGLPKTVILTSEEIRHALDEPVTQIIDAIKSTLDKTPPELAADIMDRGIVLAGGGALLTGLDERLRHETLMPVHLAESPLTCVAVGSGRSLEEFEVIHRSRARARATTTGARRRRAASPRDVPAPPQRASLTSATPVPRNRTARLAVLGTSRPASARAVPSRARSATRRRVVVGVLAVLSLALLSVYFRESDDGPLHGVQDAGATGLRPFQVGAERVARPFRDLYGWFDGLLGAKEENERLRAGVEDSASRRSRTRRRAGEPRAGSCSAYQDARPAFPDYRAVGTRASRTRRRSSSGRSSSRPGITSGPKDDAVVTRRTLVGQVTRSRATRRA